MCMLSHWHESSKRLRIIFWGTQSWSPTSPHGLLSDSLFIAYVINHKGTFFLLFGHSPVEFYCCFKGWTYHLFNQDVSIRRSWCAVITSRSSRGKMFSTRRLYWCRRLWLRSSCSSGVEPSILLSEGCWFSSSSLLVEVSLGKMRNPKTAPDVLVGTLNGSHRHQFMNVCMLYYKALWTKVFAKCPKIWM